MTDKKVYIPEFLYSWLKSSIISDKSKKVYDLIKESAKVAEKDSIQKLTLKPKPLITRTIKSFSQNPEFSERIKNFINALISSKGDISLTINNCNQNELGILRNVIIDNFKPDIDIEHLKIIKLLLDLIEANHFVRFVRE